jgi:hypothetical protein
VYQKSFAMSEDHGPRDALDAPGPNHFRGSIIIYYWKIAAFRGALAPLTVYPTEP